MRVLSVLLAFCTALVFAVACKKEAPPAPPPADEAAAPAPTAPEPAPAAPAPEPTPAVPAEVSPTAAAPTGPAIAEVLVPGAAFLFSLKDSPDALKLNEGKCAEEAKGDAAKQADCMAKADAAGAQEGIRLEKEGEQLIFVSFGPKAGGGEEIYLRGPITVVPGTPADTMAFRPAGPLTGLMAKDMPADKVAGMTMTIQAVDATTVVMDAPPPKGKLLYRKKG